MTLRATVLADTQRVWLSVYDVAATAKLAGAACHLDGSARMPARETDGPRCFAAGKRLVLLTAGVDGFTTPARPPGRAARPTRMRSTTTRMRSTTTRRSRPSTKDDVGGTADMQKCNRTNVRLGPRVVKAERKEGGKNNISTAPSERQKPADTLKNFLPHPQDREVLVEHLHHTRGGTCSVWLQTERGQKPTSVPRHVNTPPH